MKAENPVLLEVKNLSVEFHTGQGTMEAVRDVSFCLHKGETLGIVGESGSGKSVTALSVMRLLTEPPAHISAGSIEFTRPDFDVIDLLKLDEGTLLEYRGKHLGMIFQEPMTSLNPVMRCGRQVMETLLLHENYNHGEAKARTLALLSEVQLKDTEKVFSSYPHELSGGMRQRVMIAMAMACNPAILICDEPTTALDVTIQKNILELLRQIQQKHHTGIIFISHDLGVIAQIADTVLVMQNGSIVESGPAGGIFRNPVHAYTRGLLACRPPLEVRPKRLPVVEDYFTKSSDPNPDSDYIKPGLVWTTEEWQSRLKRLYSREPVLQVRDVKVYFPEKKSFFGKTLEWKKAVDGISFDVYPGETLGLVGESGCGKTTLGRAILRLVRYATGRILYKGTDLASLSPEALRHFRKNLQIIFQDPYSSLNPRQTAGDCITEPMMVHGLYENATNRKARALSLLHKVGLEKDHYHRYPHEFSGGQRQRICIARALALNPEFIICDESVSALDISHQAQVLNLLNDLKQEFGFTYIFITHDLSVVRFMSDRLMVMKNGKVEEMGDADEVYRHPQSLYTQTLINALPSIPS